MRSYLFLEILVHADVISVILRIPEINFSTMKAVFPILLSFVLFACDQTPVEPEPFMPPPCCGDHPSGIMDLAGQSGLTLELPEVFTPNNDGINDVLVVQTNASFNTFRLEVQQQDTAGIGTIIFVTTDTSDFWNGLQNSGSQSGEIAPADNYLVTVSGQLMSGEVFLDSLRVCLSRSCDDNIDGQSCLYPDQLGQGSPLPATNESVCD